MGVSDEGAVGAWIMLILFFLIEIIITSAVISGISHVYSVVSKKSGFAFMKVLPFVVIVLLIYKAFDYVFLVIMFR